MKQEDEVHMKRGSAGLGQDESHVILLFLLLSDYLVITSRGQKMDQMHKKSLEYMSSSLSTAPPH